MFTNTPTGWSLSGLNMCVDYTNAAGHAVGTRCTWDGEKKRMNYHLATRFNMGDHNLGMKVTNEGVAQLLFGWKQNSAVTGRLGT